MNVYYFHHQADELLGTASEQFLGKSVAEIKQTILQTLEGHLRAILGECGFGERTLPQHENAFIHLYIYIRIYNGNVYVNIEVETQDEESAQIYGSSFLFPYE